MEKSHKYEPLVFTPEFLETLRGSGKPFERGYFKLLATYPRLESFRVEIESVVRRFPSEKRNKIIQDIRSSEDYQSLSALTELFVYQGLTEVFDNVEVEPEIYGKTPDFVTDGKYVFEVATQIEKENHIFSSIVESINEIKNGLHVFISSCDIPHGLKNVKTSVIKKEFISLFQKFIEDTSNNSFRISTVEGIKIRGLIAKKSKSRNYNVGSVSKSYTGTGEEQKEMILNVIKKKKAKYRRLSKNGYPFVLILKCRFSSFHDYEWLDLILGYEGHQNGIFQPNKNTSISAILVAKYDSLFDKYWLFKNPYSINPISKEVLEKLNQAFEVESAEKYDR